FISSKAEIFHSDLLKRMDCSDCHEGEVSFAKGIETLELVEKNVIELCVKCHSSIINVHHPLRVQVTVPVPDYIPLSEGRAITCITCHDIHSEDVSMHLLRSSSIGDYKSRIDLCYECHIDDFKKISPHKSEELGLSCLTCHRDTPEKGETADTVTLITEDIVKMCNFCHIIDTEKHPLNVDETISISKALPLSKDGKTICTTCHDPHGTMNTINFLRERYVTDVEFSKYEDPHEVKEYYSCLKCHLTDEDNIELKSCKYEDDYIILCYNCHSSDLEKCHPINIPLEESMTLPKGFELNEDNLISCVTCHNPDCNSQTTIRYRNIGELRRSSCNDCHNNKGLNSVNPHLGKDNTASCFYCHKRGVKIGDFGMSQKFVCLKCHPLVDHPANKEHLKAPNSQMNIIPEIMLDGKGKIKCSSCHDPHMPGSDTHKLRQYENILICEACHQF
ncbi:cytochrome c3 family protein, partial [Thermodesulfobacteriota bacterium]